MDGATLDSDLGLRNVRLPASHKTAVTPPPIIEAEAVHRGPNWVMLGIAATVVILAGAWFVIRTKVRSDATQAAAPAITAHANTPTKPATPPASAPGSATRRCRTSRQRCCNANSA